MNFLLKYNIANLTYEILYNKQDNSLTSKTSDFQLFFFLKRAKVNL